MAVASGPPGRPPDADNSLPELLKQLSEETQTLVRLEIALAKAEMTEKGKKAGKGAGFLGAAGLLGLGAFGAFTACLIALIATVVDHVWLAALIVTLIYAAIAAVLAKRGQKEIKATGGAAPEQTIETLKEDAQWAKTLK
ncbi:MAG: phage holin family protein [Solirubrobacterales bacterium]|nr:phage holin family protein [Solirubrobacterales bacterium]